MMAVPGCMLALVCGYHLPSATRHAPLVGPTTALSLRSSLASIAMKNFDDFDELAAEVKSYLASLDAAMLEDPKAPSPLAYIELQSAGRVDLVEGMMKHGGYLAVSRKLGVRLQDAPPPSAPVANPWKQPEPEDVNVGAGVSLSGAAKEDKMAADLARLAAQKTSATAGPTVITTKAPAVARGDQLAPLRKRATVDESDLYARDQSAAERSPQPALFLDGLQRAEMALLIGLFAVGFGRTSAQVLEPSLASAVQLAFGALAVGHLVIGGYGGFLASQAPPEQRHSPAGWFVKCAVTGVAGLSELNRMLAR